VQLTALVVLIRDLGEASGDAGSLQRYCKVVASIQAPVAPVWRHWLEPHRAAFEHGLQPVDAPITLSQTLGPTEAIGRTSAHAKLFEAEPAAWRVIDEPELSASGSALRATKIGPRAAVRELRVSLVCSPNGIRAHWSSSLITPVALRRDTLTLTSSSKKVRLSRRFRVSA
jgi:hypothetical protein